MFGKKTTQPILTALAVAKSSKDIVVSVKFELGNEHLDVVIEFLPIVVQNAYTPLIPSRQ
jgi:hypothetical protein